jgi:hypothetical protein
MTKHNRRTVGGNFYNIVRRIRVGFREIGGHHFVEAAGDARATSAVRGLLDSGQVGQIAEYGSSRFEIPGSSQHRLGDSFGLRSSESDHPNTGPAGWCRDGNDSVVQVHFGEPNREQSYCSEVEGFAW